MATFDDVTAQLESELETAVYALAVLAGPDAVLSWPQVLSKRAGLLAIQLLQDSDDNLAAQTTIDIMAALWPHGAPETVGRAEWWRTPVGRLCARSLGTDEAESVTYSVAAAMLGISRGATSTLVSRGRLDRHPDGGVTRVSVLQRLAERGAD